MKKGILLSILVLGLVLAACSSVRTPEGNGSITTPVAAEVPTAVKPTPLELTDIEPTQPVPDLQAASTQDLLRSDAQGAVTVEVAPINLNQGTDTLEFEVSMNTHSVDLSMNLALLSTLSTNNGQTVQALSWDAPAGGHHVSGTLTFPASLDGKPLLDGASTLTLLIKDVDALERVFTWELSE